MPRVKIRLRPETLRSRDSSTFTGSYQTLGTALTEPARIMKITNDSDQDVTISWDGSTDHEFIPAGSFMLLDCTTNRVGQGVLAVADGTQFYVKGSAGTGLVYLSCYFAQ